MLKHAVPKLFVLAIAVGGLCAPAFADRQSPTVDPLFHRETPDDLPGKPAQPLPGAAPVAPVVYGSFVSRQANVSPFGLNIVGDAANEPSITVDPANPNLIVIGWRQFDTIASNFRQAGYAYSTDGGRHWTFPGVLDPGVFRSDPVLSSDSQGRAYYNSLKVVGNDYTCDVFVSLNGGANWGPPIYAYGGDKQWMTIDRTGGASDGHIYCAWSTAAGCCGNNTFTRSTTGGQSYETPIGIPFTPIWGTLDVAANGDLYIGGASPSNLSQFLVAKSTNAKNALVTPTFAVTSPSLNGMMTFGVSIGPNPGGLLGQVSIAVDRSTGPMGGNIYMLCSVDPSSADPVDIHFTRSDDGGSTWSVPVRVNDDVGNNWQWFGTMSVSPDGRIDAIWNDTRNGGGAANQSELFYSSSFDGGVTWSPNQKVSPMWNSYAGWPNQNKIGDYYGMISDRVGAHVAWAATFNGEQDVYYLRIGDYDCNGNGVGDSLDVALGTSTDANMNGIPDECEGLATAAGERAPRSAYSLAQNTPNPFNPATTIRFEVAAAGGRVRLDIFDVAGRLVRTLADRDFAPGPQSLIWDARDSDGRAVASGLYLYRLEAPGFSKTRKMIYLK